jgi:uncharacterized protein (DUF433 family)
MVFVALCGGGSMELTLPPELTRDTDGEIVVTHTRVLFYYVVLGHQAGESAEDLARGYPHISTETFRSLIAYCHANKLAVDAFVDEYTAALERNRLAAPPPRVTREELLARLAAKGLSPMDVSRAG